MRTLRVLTVGAAMLLATAFAQVPRTSDGHPDLSGIWRAVGTANHPAEAGSFNQLGAIGAIPPGPGVFEGGDIPYKPDALAKRKDDQSWLDRSGTATFPLTSEPGYEIFEHACHEGSYSMRNSLSAARASEQKDAEKDAAKAAAEKE